MSAQNRTTFKELPPTWNLKGLSVLAFAHGASDFFSGMVPLLIFTVVSADGLSPVYQGAIGFLWYLTSSIVQPLFGLYSDTRGRWWFLPTGVLLTVSSVCLGTLSPNVAVLAVLVVIGGIGSGILHPEAGKYSAMLSGSRKAGGISIFQIGGQIGYSFGPVAFGWMRDFGGAGTLVILVCGLVATAALFATMNRVDRAAVRDHRAQEPAVGAVPESVDRPGVTLLVVSTALRYLVGAAFMTYLPNLVVAHGGSTLMAGAAVTAFLAVGSVGLFAGGYIADRLGAVSVSIASLVLAVPFLYGFFLLSGAFGFASLLIGGALLSMQGAPAIVLAQRMMPRNLGMALGLMNGVGFGVGSALVAVVGFAVAASGPAAALENISALPLGCALAFAIVGMRSGNTMPQ